MCDKFYLKLFLFFLNNRVLWIFVFLLNFISVKSSVELFNNFKDSAYISTRIGGSIDEYAQRFTTTDSTLISSIELKLRRNTSDNGICYVNLFTDRDNAPYSFWRIGQFDIKKDIDTVFKTVKVQKLNFELEPNTNYWISIGCYGAGFDWAYTKTPSSKSTSHAYFSYGSQQFTVKNTQNTPQVMRIVAKSPKIPVIPSGQAYDVSFFKTTNSQTDISWTSGSGDYRLVFVKKTNTGNPIVENKKTYIASSVFGEGSNDGNGWYCVYKGFDNYVSVSGLLRNTTYRVKVIEFNGSSGKELYQTTEVATNPVNFTTSSECISFPGNAQDIIGSSKLCAGTQGANYSTSVISDATSYLWSYSGTGASLTGTGNTVSINFASNATSGTLTVLGQNECGIGSNSARLPLTINSLPKAADSISGLREVLNGTSGVNYFIKPIQFATSYFWAITGSGATITKNGKDSTALNFVNASSNIYLRVVGQNDCGTGASSPDLTIKVNVLPNNAEIIAGTKDICNGITYSYKTSEINYATSYVWEYNSPDFDTTIITTSKSLSLTLPLKAKSGFLKVKGRNSVGDGLYSDNFQITLNYFPNSAPPIIGNSSVCQYSDEIFTVTKIDNATTYEWSYTGLGASNSGIKQIDTIRFSKTATTGLLSVKGKSACGDGTASSMTIVVKPFPDNVKKIFGDTAVCAGATNILFRIDSVPNATSYVWNSDMNTDSLTKNGKMNTICFSTKAVNFNLSVAAKNECGISQSVSLPIRIKHVPNKPDTIVGLASICEIPSITTYRIPKLENCLLYRWTYRGDSVSIKNMDEKAELSFSNLSKSGNLFVRGENECGLGATSTIFSIAVTPVRKPLLSNAIRSQLGYCEGDSIYCSNFEKNMNYEWWIETPFEKKKIARNTIVFGYNATGMYRLKVQNGNCVSFSDSTKILVYNIDTVTVKKKTDGVVTLLMVNNFKKSFVTYRWTKADSSTIDPAIVSTNQVIVFTDTLHNGYYKVFIIDKNGCKTESLDVLVQNSLRFIKTFPTVNNGIFSLQVINEQIGTLTVKLIDTNGNSSKTIQFEKLDTQTTVQIDAQNVNTGSYILETEINGIKSFSKIIIQR